MKYTIVANTVVVANLVVAAAAHTASAPVAEHVTEQRELWGSGMYKWMPKEPEECYDVRPLSCFISFSFLSRPLVPDTTSAFPLFYFQ